MGPGVRVKNLRRLCGLVFCENFIHLALKCAERFTTFVGICIFANVSTLALNDLRRLCCFVFCAGFLHLALSELQRLCGFCIRENLAPWTLNGLRRLGGLVFFVYFFQCVE